MRKPSTFIFTEKTNFHALIERALKITNISASYSSLIIQKKGAQEDLPLLLSNTSPIIISID